LVARRSWLAVKVGRCASNGHLALFELATSNQSF
jgi:hypothetical protein